MYTNLFFILKLIPQMFQAVMKYSCTLLTLQLFTIKLHTLNQDYQQLLLAILKDNVNDKLKLEC